MYTRRPVRPDYRVIHAHEPAPGFTLPGTDGETIEVHTLSEFTTTGPTKLAFYPFDFGPVCVDQLCALHDLDWLTIDADVDVLGLSLTAPILVARRLDRFCRVGRQECVGTHGDQNTKFSLPL